MISKINWLYHKPIAHRGLYNEKCPENSLEAFENAVKHQYAIELDVHMTKDHKIIVFHDNDTFRMTGVKGNIEDKTLNELKSLSLAGTSCRIPLLQEVFDCVGGKTEILIEIKSGKYTGKLEKALTDLIHQYPGKTAVQSFYPYSLVLMKKLDKKIPRGQLASDFKKDETVSFPQKFVSKNMLFNFAVKPDFIAFDIDSLPNKKVEKFRKKKGPVLAYTINNQQKLDKSQVYCDNIIFEGITPLVQSRI